MAISKISIGFSLDPIVKIYCSNSKCLHNLCQITDSFCCNLKYVHLDEDGKCTYFIDKEEYINWKE